jgi:hypothetical protein
MKYGAYYFDGWTGKTGHVTDRLQTEFADREPVWGWLDDTREIMDMQIRIASNSGLSFFSFCWYYGEVGSGYGGGADTPLNQALSFFQESALSPFMEFSLLIANHAGFRIGSAEWPAVTEIWIESFRKANYLKVDGKPLLSFFSANELVSAFGSPQAVRAALDELRRKAREKGLPGVTVAAGTQVGPREGWEKLDLWAQAGFDYFTDYNCYYAGDDGASKVRDFDMLVAGHEKLWEEFARRSTLPYIPVITAGWDMRPWEPVDKPAADCSVRFTGRSPEHVTRMMRMAGDWAERNPLKTSRDRIALLYAWNENGEGAYLTPTKAESDTYLRAIGELVSLKTRFSKASPDAS